MRRSDLAWLVGILLWICAWLLYAVLAPVPAKPDNQPCYFANGGIICQPF